MLESTLMPPEVSLVVSIPSTASKLTTETNFIPLSLRAFGKSFPKALASTASCIPFSLS
nr:MAG TPA: hypothetical protein [Caudoviricetes sp.]